MCKNNTFLKEERRNKLEKLIVKYKKMGVKIDYASRLPLGPSLELSAKNVVDK